ncbi:lysyl-tRNA synthetase, class 2 [Sanguibacter gelidistatuariae]|uniref:Lysyl-tRNA synthetase, class 2 n=2 Tax=Sanguibacter gelidistatuariae TaxID=1814289 RepID=A0A1G6GSV7_9MICO|nr:lysyl-tRNA synthetase, class 2 [Sanguibacter gelidistatuariae]
MVAALGVVGLLSTVTRPLRGRLHDLLDIVPSVVPHAAAITLIFVSFGLLLVGRGLRSGQRLAWIGALALLGASVVLHVTKGLDVEEAALSAVAGIWLVTKRAAFPVRPSWSRQRAAILLAVAGTVTALIIAYVLSAAAVERIHPDRIDHGAHATRWLGDAHRGTVVVALALGLLGSVLWVVLSASTPRPLVGEAHRRERERARLLVDRYGDGSLDYFALRDDKQWFFTSSTVVAHTVRTGVCLVSPDPIGPDDGREEAWADFMAYAERNGWSVAVLGAGADWLEIYESFGLRPVYLGDEAVVDAATFTLDGRAMRGVRQAYNRVNRAGLTTTFHDPRTLSPHERAELAAIATQSRQGDAERGFSMTLSRMFDPDDTGLLLSVARDHAGVAQAFIQWVPFGAAGGDGEHGWSLDVMRRRLDSELPNGVMEFVVIDTITKVVADGGGLLTLNFAVMRDFVAGERTGRGAKIMSQLVRRTTSHAQVESLWRFNAKFGPQWRPRYAVLGAIDSLVRQGLVMSEAEGVIRTPKIFEPGRADSAEKK